METSMELPIIKNMTSEAIKQELKDNGVVVHHKTGIEKLMATLDKVRNGVYENTNVEEPVTTIPAGVKHQSLPGSTPASRAAKAKAVNALYENLTPEQRALKLTRIVVTPNDPLMTAYPGLIFTVGASGVNNGEMVKKFVPFNNEEGWHVPQIILNQIEHAEMQKFKTVTRADGEKVLEPYITKKFNVRILPELSIEELEKLAASQQAAGFGVGVDN